MRARNGCETGLTWAVLATLAAAACTGGTAGTPPDAGPPALPPEVLIDGPEQLAVGAQAVFRVRARRKGKAAQNEPVRVRTESGAEVFAGITGPSGACDVRFDVAQVAKEGDEQTHLIFEVGTPPSQHKTSRTLSVKSAWRPILDIDHRRIYPGGRVTARLLVLHPDIPRGVGGVVARIEFLTPQGIPVEHLEGVTDEAGMFAASLTLQSHCPWGEWMVRATGGETLERTFTVLPSPSGEAPTKPLPSPPTKPAPKTLDFVLRPASGLLAGGLDNPLIALVTLGDRPAVGAEVVVSHGDDRAKARTGEKGEAWMSLAIPKGGAPVTLRVRISDDRGRHLEREVTLPAHPGGVGLVVRPEFAVAPPGESIRIRISGPSEGEVVVDAWRRGRLVATLSSTLIEGEASVDARPKVLGSGLVWFVARNSGRGADSGWGAAPTFVPPMGSLTMSVKPGAPKYTDGETVTIQIAVEDSMAKPTGAALFGVLREVEEGSHDDGRDAALLARRKIARRLLDGLPDRQHLAGNLYDLVARSLDGPVTASEQAVARLHLAGLRYEAGPAPWPRLPGAEGDPATVKTPAKRFARGPAPRADRVTAFPGDLKAKGDAPAILEVETRDQAGAQAGAFIAMSEGRIGVVAVSVPIERGFTLSVTPPRHVTAGDVIEVPVTVQNHLDRTQGVDLRIELAEWFDMADAQQTRVKPGPGAAETVWFRIKVKDVGTHEVRVVARSDKRRRSVSTSLVVHADGQPYEVVRAGILMERMTVVKFTLPPVTKDVREEAVLTLDPSRDHMLERALDAVFSSIRSELASEAAVTRVAARIATDPGVKSEALKAKAQALLAPQLQRLLRFLRSDGGWAWWRGGAASEAAAIVAARTLELLIKAHILGSEEAAKGLPPPKKEAAAATQRHASLNTLLQSREGDGGWGSLIDTDEAVSAILAAKPIETTAIEVFVEMDGKPLKKEMFDPAGSSMTIPLPDRIAPGAHFVKIEVPSPKAGLPWTLLLRTSVKWPKKPEPVAGWKVKLKATPKAKRGGKVTLKLTLTRTEEVEAGDLAFRLALPPGALPVRADLEDAVAAGTLAGYELAPGLVDLFFHTEGEEGPLETLRLKLRTVATNPGKFRSPPSSVWTLADPGMVFRVRGPKLKVK